MTRSIVQGSEDPLLVLDHQGGTGNPTFVIQQDETAVAYIWWDQVNQILNMGPASAVSLQIFSNGLVGMGNAIVDLLTVKYLTVQDEFVVNAQQGTSVTGGMIVDSLLVTGNVQLQGNIVGGLGVNGDMGVQGNIQTNTLNVNEGMLLQGPIFGEEVAVMGQEGRGTVLSVSGNISAEGDVTAANFVVSASEEIKENITNLSSQEALEALEHLSPVKFNFKVDNAKEEHIGFIAENVPQSVASSDGKSVSLSHIVAILTQVIKEQQKTIDALSEKCHSLELDMNPARR